MAISRGRQWLVATCLGAVLIGTAGSQTWVGGMTLPSGHYLQHPPQFIPDDPPFPLANELAHQEQDAQMERGGPPGAP